MYLDNCMLKYSSDLSSGFYNDDHANREGPGEHSDVDSYNAYDCDCLKLLALPFACFLCCVWPLSLCACGQRSRVEEEDARTVLPPRVHHDFGSAFAR
jgi:hypothetical protein